MRGKIFIVIRAAIVIYLVNIKAYLKRLGSEGIRLGKS